MCSRYIQLPTGEIWVIPGFLRKFLPGDSVDLGSAPYTTQPYIVALKDYLSETFKIQRWADEPIPSFHTCPTNLGTVVLEEKGGRVARNFRFGMFSQWLIPHPDFGKKPRAKEKKLMKNEGHNFRSDNLLPKSKKYQELGLATNRSSAGNRMFWPALKEGRCCLAILYGAIEWNKKGNKAYCYSLADRRPFAVPALWDDSELVRTVWYGTKREEERPVPGPRFSLATTDPCQLMNYIDHDRKLKVLFDEKEQALWLSDAPVEEKVKMLQTPSPSEPFIAWEIDRKKVGNPSYKEPDVIEAVGPVIEGAKIQFFISRQTAGGS